MAAHVGPHLPCAASPSRRGGGGTTTARGSYRQTPPSARRRYQSSESSEQPDGAGAQSLVEPAHAVEHRAPERHVGAGADAPHLRGQCRGGAKNAPSKRTGTWRLPKPPMSNWKKRCASVSSAAGSTRPVTAIDRRGARRRRPAPRSSLRVGPRVVVGEGQRGRVQARRPALRATLRPGRGSCSQRTPGKRPTTARVASRASCRPPGSRPARALRASAPRGTVERLRAVARADDQRAPRRRPAGAASASTAAKSSKSRAAATPDSIGGRAVGCPRRGAGGNPRSRAARRRSRGEVAASWSWPARRPAGGSVPRCRRAARPPPDHDAAAPAPSGGPARRRRAGRGGSISCRAQVRHGPRLLRLHAPS